MLAVQNYPLDVEPYASTPKTLAFREAAEREGHGRWFLPDLAVTFANEGSAPVPGEPIREEHPNLHGRTRYTCRLVGECDVGCNYGSKKTLDYTYLSAAARHGAELRPLCEVKTFRPREGGGFEIDYVVHEPNSEGAAPRPETITADTLVLSAGTLGTTFLLLKTRDAFGGLPPALGTHFCGNGDLLTFALRCRDHINPDYGPVITSAVRFGDAADGDGSDGRGFYIEDAGYPSFLSWMLQAADEPRALWLWRKAALRLFWKGIRRRPQPDISGAVSSFFGDAALSAGVLRLPDGARRQRRRGRRLGPRPRRPGPAHRRRLRHAGARRPESQPDDRGARGPLRGWDHRGEEPVMNERVVPFRARDGFEANLINVRGTSKPEKGPVLLVHGAGVRANIFRAPSGGTIVDALVDAGY